MGLTAGFVGLGAVSVYHRYPETLARGAGQETDDLSAVARVRERRIGRSLNRQ